MNAETSRDHVFRETFRLPPTDTAGLSLHVRHARPQGESSGTIVLVHGATLASGLWDIPVPGYSLMNLLARAGYSVWAPDIRGYARSDRMQRPENAYAGREEAVRDIEAVINHACQQDNVGQVLVVGGSWGSITSSIYAIRHPEMVCGLVLLAPIYAGINLVWLKDLSETNDRTQRRQGASVRHVDERQIQHRWDAEVVHGDPEHRRDPAVIAALVDDAVQAEGRAGREFTVPNGTLDDLFECFNGRALYEPWRIRAPVLLIRGEHDITSTDDDVRRLFSILGSRRKSYIQIGDSGHFLCAERQAPQLHSALLAFSRSVFTKPEQQFAIGLPS